VIVQLPGTAVWLSAHGFHQATNQSPAIRDLVVRYNDLLFSQVQQSVACNALHPLEARLARWLLQTHDCALLGGGVGEFVNDEPTNPRDLMRPFPAGLMRMWPISTRVNKPENDDPSIVGADRADAGCGLA